MDSYCAGSIWRRNWPFLTRSPCLTAISVIRPVMSALMSTLVFASILPLAVTAATRSRVPTGSSRTSVARLPFLEALRATNPPTTTRAIVKNSVHLARRDMKAPRLTQGAADGELEQRDGLVVFVHRGHVVTFSAGYRILGIRDLERGAAAQTIAILGQADLFARGDAALLLRLNGAVAIEHGEILPRDVGLHRQFARAHALRSEEHT